MSLIDEIARSLEDVKRHHVAILMLIMWNGILTVAVLTLIVRGGRKS